MCLLPRLCGHFQKKNLPFPARFAPLLRFAAKNMVDKEEKSSILKLSELFCG